MKAITDLRILKAIEKKYHIKFDRDFKYCTQDNNIKYVEYKGEHYKIQYFDGCFYPYLVKI